MLTFAPTETPTWNPTTKPTPSPTRYPQTEDPTLFPTLDGSSVSPSNQPTLNPSINATQWPNISEAPTPFPSVSPTVTAPTLLAIVAPPTDAPILSFQYEKTTLRIRDATVILFRSTRQFRQNVFVPNSELDANCTSTWQVSIQERIKSEMASVIQDFEALHVELRDLSTSSNETAWSLTFDVFMEIRAASLNNLDPVQIFLSAFDSQSDKVSYIQYLKATYCDEFENIDSVYIYVPTVRDGPTSSDKKSGSEAAALYASLAVGLAAIVMAGITVCCYLHSRNKRRVNDLGSAEMFKEHARKSNNDFMNYASRAPSVIGGKSKVSDVSTLGDPIPFGVIPEQNDDLSSANESCSLEYDFKKAFLDVHSTSESLMCGTIDDQVSATGMTVNDDSETTDGFLPHKLRLMAALADDVVTTTGDGTGYSSPDEAQSVENKFEVIVPKGLLGLILESHTDNGRPIVNSIKPNTALFSVARVGDYIDGVDGVNVKNMTANDVSQLIVQKKEEVRVLEFSRPIRSKTFHL